MKYLLLPSLFLLSLLFNINNNGNGSVNAYPGMVSKPDTNPKARIYRAKEMVNMMKEIRQGDYRLVRPSPSEETEIEQHRYCTYKLNSYIMTLCTSTAANRSLGKMAVSLHKRGIAAEGVTLCLTNQPQFRDNAANTTFMTDELNHIQQRELVGHSLAEGLVVVLKEGIAHYKTTKDGASVLAMAQAAETVWISSFHHPTHIQNFLTHNVIEVLAEIIFTMLPEAFSDTIGTNNRAPKLEHGYPQARVVMWCFAALQNLAANYCDNDLAFCMWEWNDNGELVLDEETRLEAPELADQVRERIAAVPKLIETIGEWACQGPIMAKANETYGWPGDAILWKDLTFNAYSQHLYSPSIVPWAATGVIKNLLLGKNNPALIERIHNLPHLTECLCALERSPDWLEQSKSTDAIFRWSPEWEGLCPDIYATCQDDSEWESAESGDNCEEFDKERWCVEYGEDVGKNGKTANEACCACGGGYPKDSVGDNDGAAEAEAATIAPEENTTTEETALESDMGESLAEAAVEMEAAEATEEQYAAESATHEEL